MARRDKRGKEREKRRLPLAATDAVASAPRGPRPQRACLTCGLCCTYIAVAIDAPDSVQSATEILWHLYHDHVSIYRDSDDEWMVQFETRCRHLASDNKCAIYETRPHICRTYSEESCEVNSEDEGMNFYTPQAFLDYLQHRSGRIFQLVQKRYMPEPQHLGARTYKPLKEPSFEKRFLALRGSPQ